jgi:hypothetical protein
MIDPNKEANLRPLSPGCTPNPSMDHPIMHRGWNIYKWTGWKGNTSIFEDADHVTNRFPVKCSECGKPFQAGDRFIETQATDNIFHFECSNSQIKGQMIGQWVAFKLGANKDHSDDQFAYAGVPGNQGPFNRGDAFLVIPQGLQEALYPDTPQEKLEQAREEGLVRLKAVIDEIENAAN